ncbi:hydrolase [Methylobacterium sp. Leaf104]|uniref:Cof-type HAD-IIB family hydrolase n=1 Tax=Methylobacterium TaxID=407 RepID=UPI0006F86584|nr:MULTISPECIES: Cof-type HAD-IIB family hydrolase [Methylobacterium]KQP41544.1 hydrolase [Methylobacterium sp. Leaf104]MCI9881661.1 Cof-type HAD-IIB family hydrolase [Methylobacterium goesingense]
MPLPPDSTPADIALVISDVDGTLVTTDKALTPATRAAVRRLAAAGIAFTIASSRPPVGLRSLAAELGLTLPMGAYNGSTLVAPDFTILSETLIPAEAAREAVRRFTEAGLDTWVFARGQWNLTDPHGAYTDLERRTLQAEPNVVADLAPLLGEAAKIVGVSADAAHLEACETEIAAALTGRADVHRSQAYYLDVTPPGSGKAAFVDAMSRHLGLDRSRIATLGDAANDVPMFARSGFSVAMGNAAPAVQAAARAVTSTNDADGFAKAVDEFILRR